MVLASYIATLKCWRELGYNTAHLGQNYSNYREEMYTKFTINVLFLQRSLNAIQKLHIILFAFV